MADVEFQIRLACLSLELESTIPSHCLPPSLEVVVKALCDLVPACLSHLPHTIHSSRTELPNAPQTGPEFSHPHTSADDFSIKSHSHFKECAW